MAAAPIQAPAPAPVARSLAAAREEARAAAFAAAVRTCIRHYPFRITGPGLHIRALDGCVIVCAVRAPFGENAAALLSHGHCAAGLSGHAVREQVPHAVQRATIMPQLQVKAPMEEGTEPVLGPAPAAFAAASRPRPGKRRRARTGPGRRDGALPARRNAGRAPRRAAHG